MRTAEDSPNESNHLPLEMAQVRDLTLRRHQLELGVSGSLPRPDAEL